MQAYNMLALTADGGSRMVDKAVKHFQALVLYEYMLPIPKKRLHLVCNFLLLIQICWKFKFALTPILALRSQQNFARHDSTAVVKCAIFFSDPLTLNMRGPS